MIRPRKLSSQSLTVLGALANRPTDWLYGLEMTRLTNLKSGSLYPILIRLSDRGLLESRWLEPSEPGRPPRHAYRITADGRAALTNAVRESRTSLRERRA